MHRASLSAALALALLAVALAPTRASAQTIEDGTITVVQPKPVLRRMRLQLTPRFASTLNDAVYRQYSAGGTLVFNVSERLAVGGLFEWFDFDGALGGTTAAYEEIIETTEAVPEVAPLTWIGGLELNYVPLYGKLVLFNKVIGYFDLYLAGGVVAVESSDDIHVGGTVGVGFNLYFNRWLGLNTEFRDRMTVEELPTQGRSFTNTVTGSLGLTILMPFNFKYRFDDEADR